jgi:hypothetical protein
MVLVFIRMSQHDGSEDNERLPTILKLIETPVVGTLIWESHSHCRPAVVTLLLEVQHCGK